MNNEHGINYLKKIIPEDNLKIYLKSELKKYLNNNLNINKLSYNEMIEVYVFLFHYIKKHLSELSYNNNTLKQFNSLVERIWRLKNKYNDKNEYYMVINCPFCNVNKFFVYENVLYKCKSCGSFSKEYLVDSFFDTYIKDDIIDYKAGYYDKFYLREGKDYNNKDSKRIRIFEYDGEEVGADYGYLEDCYDDE